MSASGGFLVPDELAYPRELGPYTDPNKEPEGFFVRMFRPKLIPYPLPQGCRRSLPMAISGRTERDRPPTNTKGSIWPRGKGRTCWPSATA